MKAILTLVYEANVRDNEQKEFLINAERIGDDQSLSEHFDMGWKDPISSKIDFEGEFK